MELANRTLLISGGSSGLGAACAAHLAAAGANIVIADLAPPAAFPPDHAARMIFVRTDVTSEDDVRAAIDQGRQRFGGLSGAVCCAGILHAERVLGREGPANLAAFKKVLEVNVAGTFNVARLAAEAIAKSEPDGEGERGVLVFTASVAAFDGQIGQASYAASKGAVASLVLPLARELARVGIRVLAIAPGVFETPMMQAAPEKVRQSLMDQTPFPPRFGRPEEFAALVQTIFENRMLNGTTLRLDGALRMGAK
ncbi:MAG TPA: SDR family NAD(P)-dependent oxidoreductase [Planctomycetia bacterium]|nr:SDR family NAD(P)-dependent oxidoreductase [Planctomycetia bacterium]